MVDPLLHPAVRAAYNVAAKGGATNWNKEGELDRIRDLVERYGSFDGCYDARSIKKRFLYLDSLIQKISEKRKLEGMQNRRSVFRFREMGGIEIAFASNGQLIKVGDGQHRLGIALGLGLDIIPATLVLVHADYTAPTLNHIR